MLLPLEITFREVQKTEDVEQLIREKSAKLERICNYITSCRVTVEKPQAHPHSGIPYRVSLDIKVPPCHEIVVKKEPTHAVKSYIPLSTEIRNVFKTAERQLKEITERQHGG
jgi:hypothetical protein